MKLMLITAIKAFEGDIKHLLKAAKVNAYTYNDAIGFKDHSMENLSANWFATDNCENESIVFHAFISDDLATAAIDLVQSFNQQQDTLSKVHLALLNIENLY
jgi:hypothetical protein